MGFLQEHRSIGEDLVQAGGGTTIAWSSALLSRLWPDLDCLQLRRLPVQEWARLAPEPEVQAQSLRYEFLRLVFGHTRWWEPANSLMRARLSEVLEAACLPGQELQAMRILAAWL